MRNTDNIITILHKEIIYRNINRLEVANGHLLQVPRLSANEKGDDEMTPGAVIRSTRNVQLMQQKRF